MRKEFSLPLALYYFHTVFPATSFLPAKATTFSISMTFLATSLDFESEVPSSLSSNLHVTLMARWFWVRLCV